MREYVLPVFYVVLQLLVIIAIGYVVRKSGGWADSFFQGLSRLVVRVALPFYFIVRVSGTDFSQLRTIALMPIAALIVVSAGILFSFVLFSLLPFKGSDRRAGIAMAAFGNSGYMPLSIAEFVPVSIPVIGEMFGTNLAPVLVAAYLIAQSPLLWSVGRALVTTKEGAGSSFRLRYLASPPLIGILIGLALAATGLGRLAAVPTSPVSPVFSALGRVADITLPLALLNLGGLIGGLEVERSDWRLLMGVSGGVVLVRFVLIPALFYLAVLLGLREVVAPAVLFVLFLVTHTPPATNLSLMATESGVNEHHTAVTLLGSYLLYLVLMPAYLTAFLSITLP